MKKLIQNQHYNVTALAYPQHSTMATCLCMYMHEYVYTCKYMYTLETCSREHCAIEEASNSM